VTWWVECAVGFRTVRTAIGWLESAKRAASTSRNSCSFVTRRPNSLLSTLILRFHLMLLPFFWRNVLIVAKIFCNKTFCWGFGNIRIRFGNKVRCKIRSLLSRRSRQRERLSASVLSICLLVCLFVCLPPKCKKTQFSQKLSNLELWYLLTTYRKLCNWAFQRTHYWIPKIQDGWYPPSWKSTGCHFFSAEGGPIWIKFRRLMQNDMLTAVMWLKSKPDVEF